MAATATDIALDALTYLAEFDLCSSTLLQGPVSITSVSLVSGTIYQINLSASVTSGIVAGHLVYVNYGPAYGYHVITTVGANYVQFDNGTSTNNPTSGAVGEANIYRYPIQYLVNRISNNFIPYAQKVTRMNFTGIQTYTEYHSGTGTAEIMLDRRNPIAVTAVQLLSIPQDILTIPLSAIEVLPMGVLRVRATNLDTFTSFAPLWPKGVDNIKITYTAGFTDYPADVREAIMLLASADLLGQEEARAGGGISLSVVNWSKSYGPRGRFGTRRNDMVAQASALLRRYRTSVVGA